jgi:hypothetical protein
MTRSIFDPGGGETERSGSTFGSETADNRSHVPRDTVDGEVTHEERADDAESAEDARAQELAPEERLAETQKTDPDASPRDQERP